MKQFILILFIFTIYSHSAEKKLINSYGIKPNPLQKELQNQAFSAPATNFQTVYDLRNTNYLTGVKNQDTCGACWTFATMAAVESFLKKKGYGSFDLSEQNLKNLNRFDKNPCSKGGDPYMSQSYFSRGGGPVLETEDPYNSGVHSSYTFTPQFYLGESRHLPKNSSINTIKQAILDHGAIFSTMYWHINYFNSQNNTYYSNTNNYGNHAITLAGWNDTLTTSASQKGAWIVKNSYGTGWGENGFFYISYYDNSLHDDVAYWPQKYAYGNKYFANGYDEVGLVSYYGFNSNSADCIMRYTPNSKGENLLKVGTWAVSAGASIAIEIYDDFNGSQLSNKLASISSQTCNEAGFYSFSLPDTLALTQNDDIYVKVSYTTPNFNYPVPIECYYSGYANPVIETNRYYYKPVNSNWSNTANDTLDLCIKVYGFANTPPVVAKPVNDTTITEGESLNLMFSIFDNENDSLTFSTITKPNGSQLQFQKNWRGGYAAYFLWDTDNNDGQSDPYQLIFKVSDGYVNIYDTSQVTVLASTAVDDISSTIPTHYQLFPNFPNPFNPTTTIRYGIPERSHVTIKIFDIKGDFIKELENSVKDAGFYSINWKTGNIPTGIYFYHLESDGFSSVRKCLYVK